MSQTKAVGKLLHSQPTVLPSGGETDESLQDEFRRLLGELANKVDTQTRTDAHLNTDLGTVTSSPVRAAPPKEKAATEITHSDSERPEEKNADSVEHSAGQSGQSGQSGQTGQTESEVPEEEHSDEAPAEQVAAETPVSAAKPQVAPVAVTGVVKEVVTVDAETELPPEFEAMPQQQGDGPLLKQQATAKPNKSPEGRQIVEKGAPGKELPAVVETAVEKLPPAPKQDVAEIDGVPGFSNPAETVVNAKAAAKTETKLMNSAMAALFAAAGRGNGQHAGISVAEAAIAKDLAGIKAAAGAQAPTGFVPLFKDARTTAQTEKGNRVLSKNQSDKLLQKVEAALKEVARSKDGKSLTVRIDPPELGKIRIDVSLRDGVLHARISPEAQTVSTLLRDRAHELHSVLRQLGLNVDSITVQVKSETPDTLTTGSEGEFSASSQGENFGESFGENCAGESGSGSRQLEETPSWQPDRLETTDHWVA